MPYRLTVWGSSQLWVENNPVELPTRKGLALLVYIALEGPQTRAQIANLLWDLSEERNRANLRRELKRLREAVPDILRSEGDTLELFNCRHDIGEFRHLLKTDHISQALTLRRGLFLEGFSLQDAPEFDEWLLLIRTQLEEDFLEAALSLGQKQEMTDVQVAIQTYKLARDCDPLAETAVQGLMRCYIKQQNTREAAEICKAFTKTLKHELGIAPSKETLTLLETVQPIQTAPKTNPSLVITPLPQDDETPLVGREKEWALLEDAWQKGQVVYISGEPGVGKTRLMLEFARSKGRYHPYIKRSEM